MESKTLLERLNLHRKNGREYFFYFKCHNCGNIIIRRSDTSAKSCGCLKKNTNHFFEGKNDLTGKTFGKLTVINHNETKNGKNFWRCKCECGKYSNVETSNLKCGISKSCGCSRANGKIREDVLGKKFGRLTVIKLSKYKAGNGAYWECKCDCGNKKSVKTHNLISGTTRSCGCMAKNPKTHGMSKTTEYRSWRMMKDRCLNKNNKSHKRYGGTGIIICDRWINSFENFIEDMGLKPSKHHSLDRINPFGNYEPSNCRWATMKQQNNNKRAYKLSYIL